MTIKVNSQTAIVFDLDDTLYNEIDFLKSAYKEIAIKLAPDSWQFLYANLLSLYRNKKNVFEYISDNYGLTTDELIHSYRNHMPNIQAFDGVLKLMALIKAKEGKIGIITDGRSRTQRNKIKALGFSEYVDHIVISEEIGSEKPDENNFLAIESKLNCSVNYYIADNIKKDFLAPKKRGWNTIGLLDNGLNIHSNAYQFQEKKYLPENFISAISELQLL